MRLTLSTLLFLMACAGTSRPAPANPAPTKVAGLQIKLVTIYVHDQEKALHFYTDVLGFQKKDDVSNAGFCWLSVTDGASELQLAANDSPAAKAFQQAMYAQSQPAIMFYTSDLAADFARVQAKGAAVKMPPTDVTMATIAQRRRLRQPRPAHAARALIVAVLATDLAAGRCTLPPVTEMPPTDVTASKIAMMNDACGNLLQLVQLTY